MKNSLRRNVLSTLSLFTVLLLFLAIQAQATTSPYVTSQSNVPLNQSTNDSINGVLPYFNSHSPIEGSISSLVDAVTADTPTDNVILGPDNTWLGVAWDFGDPGLGYMWKLSRIDVWIAAGDNLRKGYRADFSVSNSGNVDDFTVITNSLHWEGMTENSQYNYIRYDFPDEFIAGPTTDKDRYPVKGFRYLRLNSRGDGIDGVDWQTRFVEIDIWVSKIGAAPSLLSISRNPGGDVYLVWSTVAGANYAAEYKTNLNQSTWSNLGNVTADAETESIIDPATTDPQKFYRIVLQP